MNARWVRWRASTWRLPLILSGVSLLALVVGLVADGAGDVAAWVGLALPMLAIVLAMRSRH